MKSKRIESPLKIKLAIGCGSLLFFLVLLEIAMRLVGAVLLDGERLGKARDGATTIMTVGDSFTFGGGVERDEAYPAVLQRRLDALCNGQVFSVVNAGQCEVNTSQVLYDLPKQIERFKPDVIILLVGSANRFNSWTIGQHEEMVDRMRRNWYRDLRVVKMARIIALNIRSREARRGGKAIQNIMMPYGMVDSRYDAHKDYMERLWIKSARAGDSRPEDPLMALWFMRRNEKFDEGIEFANGLPDETREDMHVLLALMALHHAAGHMRDIEKMIEAHEPELRESDTGMNALAFYYRELAMSDRADGKFGDAVKFFLKAIEYDPDVFYNYYYLGKVYDLQSNYSAKMIAERLESIKASGVVSVSSFMLNSNAEFYREKRDREDGIEKWIRDDLEEFAAICEAHGVKLILQNYPVSYPMANELLHELAARRNLPIVDNLSVFSALEPSEKYFLDDDHCTPAGHEVMVDNVLRKLTEVEIVTQ